MKIIVRSDKELYIIRFTNDEKYKKQVLEVLDIIEGDKAFTLNDVLGKFQEILKIKAKSEEDRKELAEKLKKILKDFEGKKSNFFTDKSFS